MQLRDIYINSIKRWANNKVKNSMISRKLADKINRLLIKKRKVVKKEKQISLNFTKVNN